MKDAVETVSGQAHGLRTMARVLFWLVMLYIAFVTLSPIQLRPETGLPAHVERFVAFATVGVLLMMAYPQHRLRWFWTLIVLAGLLEAGQHLVAGRHGRIIDFDVKAAGAVAGCCAVLAAERVGRAFWPMRQL